MTVLIVIPSRDFDPSEVAISWKVLCDAGLRVRFATPDGRPDDNHHRAPLARQARNPNLRG